VAYRAADAQVDLTITDDKPPVLVSLQIIENETQLKQNYPGLKSF